RVDRPVERMVVGVDDSPGARAALLWAAAEAKAVGARLRAVTTWQDPVYLAAPIGAVATPPLDLTPQATALLDRMVGEARAAVGGPDIETTVLQGPPAPTLLSLAEEADLVVVG